MRHGWVSRVGMATLVSAMVLVGNTYTASGGKPAPAPAPAPPVPRVVDANNNLIGQVVGTIGEPRFPGVPIIAVVALNISGQSIIVQVTSKRFKGNATLYFTEPTCTVGQAYFDDDAPTWGHNLFPLVGVGKNPTILYSLRANSGLVSFSPAYAWIIDQNSQNGSCVLTGVTSGFIADPISDLSTQFTPPYRFVYP